MAEAITPWLHILGVTVWVGPQFFLFIAATPAMRMIEDPALRARVVRIVATRFAIMAWAALGLIVLTGISNVFQRAEDFDHLLDYHYRWVNYFSLKMVLVGVMVALTALHTFVVGPRQLELSERGETDTQELARLRRTSIILSGLVLLTSIIVIFLGALLNNHEFSWQKI
jgi:putative copper resistance protein D